MSSAWQPFTLPNGVELKNRIMKAAMEENMADSAAINHPTPQMDRLYRAWAEGGAAMVLSGHVMIDPFAVGAPADLILTKETSGSESDSRWKSMIDSARLNNTRFLLQLNHPGRQARKGTGLPTYGASPIAVSAGVGSSALFETPIEMTEEKIQDIISRFAWTAKKAEELGVDGIEIHAAHGYLISSFLSPKSNVRQDRWGGTRENRARILFETIRAIRAATKPTFIVGVKINTADFQRGGFDAQDLHWTVEQLNGLQIDFVELSGGSYEAPAMMGATKTQVQKAQSTLAREAYFLQAANELKHVVRMPLVITGGIAAKPTLDAVIASSDNVLAGIGSAMGVYPDLPNRWQKGEEVGVELAASWVLPRNLGSVAKIAQVQQNLHRIGDGKQTSSDIWPVCAMIATVREEATHLKQFNKWVHELRKDYGDGQVPEKASLWME